MNILLQSEQVVTSSFGSPAQPDTGLLGIQQEHTRGWTTGSMDNGYAFKIGFINDKARYVAMTKRSGSRWEEADVYALLQSIGDLDYWNYTAGAVFFQYKEREDGKPDGKVIATASGWHTSDRRYAFVYVPRVAGDMLIVPVKSSIDQNFPS